ncbi:MAG: OmpA family protein [Pseudobacteriovorax sp.]|nr:OmpA family protein [Pseudobacteriovorax sp.]
MSLNLLKLSLCAGIVCFGSVACVDDAKEVSEVIEAPAKEETFSVDKESGKVTFKAEIVYFEFDQHTLTKAGVSHLTALADYMKANPALDLKVQGHCDERGSTEYNLALGQKRAETVAKYLTDYGIAAKRLKSLSFGEEKLADKGTGEEAHSKNRRVDFTFINLEKLDTDKSTQTAMKK